MVVPAAAVFEMSHLGHLPRVAKILLAAKNREVSQGLHCILPIDPPEYQITD